MRRLFAELLAVLLALLAFSGCNSCQDTSILATLKAKDGRVDRDFKASEKDWKPADVGSKFRVGDAIRTQGASGAELALDDGSHLKMKEKTTIRFEERPPNSKEQALSVLTGEALLEAGAEGALLRTSLGLARIDGQGQVLLKRTDEGLRFEVHVGKAVLEAKDGKKTELKEGDSLLIGVGDAVNTAVNVHKALVIGVGDAVIEPKAEPSKPEEPEQKEAEKEEDVAGPIAAEVKGNGVSVRAPGDDAFKKLNAGSSSLAAGTAVRVRTGSSVDVSRGTSSASLRQGSYRVGTESGALVEADSGSFSLSSGGRARFVVPGGVIVTSPGASADVKTGGKKGTSVKVTASTVELQAGDETATVSAGQEGNFSPGGGIAVQGRGLDYADISVNAGESVVVHDPRPPTAIRVRFAGNCAGGGVVRSSGGGQKQFAGGKGSVSLAFKPGAHSYELFCIGDDGEEKTPAASGKLTILHDAGTRPMPKKPPSTGVLADGRTYTVLYQNQLPAVSIRWPKAPQSGSYQLVHKSSAGQRTYTTSQPSYGFRSGALHDGQHTFYFEGGGRVSRQTRVVIRFDNAAPTASLKTPGRLQVKPGGEVAIAGTAQPGWTVDVNGKKLAQDAQQRFSSKVEMPSDQRAIEVRLTHPQRGTHIYVRRAAGAE